MPIKLDVIIWYDEVDDVYLASGVSREAGLAIGQMLEPDQGLSCGCLPLIDMLPQEFMSRIPKTLTVHIYDRLENCLRDARTAKNPLQ